MGRHMLAGTHGQTHADRKSGQLPDEGNCPLFVADL